MTDVTHGLLCLLLALILTGLLGTILRWVRGTTLLAPWMWALLAVWMIASVELLGVTVGSDWSEGRRDAWRFLAGTAALCPGIAVMGAKRPQDRAWKFIVGSLWGVLALPAAKVLVLPTANSLALHPAQSWFLLALVVMGLLNWLPTRFGVAAVFGCVGCLLLLANHLPLLPALAGRARVLACLVCLVLAGCWTTWRLVRGLPGVGDARTRLWIEFRDLFGAFWSLRVAERWNAVASEREWPMVLGWRGFQCMEPATPEGVAPAEAFPEGDRTLHSLLRRFVDREWIAERGGDDE
jgi:hypothetical protein